MVVEAFTDISNQADPTCSRVRHADPTAMLTAAGASSVAISGDTVVVGGPGATVGNNADQGAAYVFSNLSTPTITWNTPAAITYGTALGNTQLDATASVAGTFTYTPTIGTVLPGGKQTLSVTFTPDDTTDYTTATASVAIR